MSFDHLLTLASFAFATVFTPGPNNLMLMASGTNYGFRRTLPHMAGVAYGFPLMVLLVGLGALRLFDLWPPAYLILKILSGAYLLYLAWKIATAAPPGEAEAAGRPLTFVQAAAFQWVNPKAWAMAISAITLYAASRTPSAIFWVAATYAVIGTFSASGWTAFGTVIRRVLNRPGRLRAFNIAMALVLIASFAVVLFNPEEPPIASDVPQGHITINQGDRP